MPFKSIFFFMTYICVGWVDLTLGHTLQVRLYKSSGASCRDLHTDSMRNAALKVVVLPSFNLEVAQKVVLALRIV